jgi:hypothetical protein
LKTAERVTVLIDREVLIMFVAPDGDCAGRKILEWLKIM